MQQPAETVYIQTEVFTSVRSSVFNPVTLHNNLAKFNTPVPVFYKAINTH